MAWARAGSHLDHYDYNDYYDHMAKSEVSVAEAKARFSELINRVAFGGDRIVITKRGKSIAILSSVSSEGIGAVKGWLDDADPFFKDLEEFEKKRHFQPLRAAKKSGKHVPLRHKRT